MTTSENTVIDDELRSFIGLETKPATYEIEKHAVARFACAIGDPNPVSWDEVAARKSSYGGLIAPPTFLRSLLAGDLPKPYPEPFAHVLDGGSSYRFFEPVRVGDRITVTRKIVDLFEKHGRMGTMLFKISETSYVNQLGQLAATQTTTTITYGTGEKDPGVGDH
ncbi:MAG: MaoC family dehydratase N-terminal domain-containing protein [Dehalococcoidia bacterium]|jgi:acyl dehydratase|nr:MaoC family dehydratase N-terminal domain-containing protein [Dehalococcoidia bacterium]